MSYVEGKKLFDEGRYMEALEAFVEARSTGDSKDLAIRDIARCYYREEQFIPAYTRFSKMAESGVLVEYAQSMMATIKTHEGEYTEALKSMKSLPKTFNNTINMATLLCLMFIHDGNKNAIYEAKKILDSIQLTDVPLIMLWRVNLCYGMIHQALKSYSAAEKSYKTAIENSPDLQSKASVYDEYGSMLIQTGEYDRAEAILLLAKEIVEGSEKIEEGLNCKWLGVLEIKRKNFGAAKGYLEIAAKILKDRRVFKELAAVNFYLSDLHKGALELKGNLVKERALEKALNFYSDGVYYESKAEEVKDRNEKMVGFIVDSLDVAHD